jgi:hypothetical protein
MMVMNMIIVSITIIIISTYSTISLAFLEQSALRNSEPRIPEIKSVSSPE